jgi:hypothetical protein
MAYQQHRSISWTFNRRSLVFNYECLRSLVLHLRPAEIQGTVDHVIRGYVLTCTLNLQWHKGTALLRTQFVQCPACDRLEQQQ